MQNTGILKHIDRLKNDINGNPIYKVYIQTLHTTYCVKTTNAHAYRIENYVNKIVNFDYKVKKNDYVLTDIELADTSKYISEQFKSLLSYKNSCYQFSIRPAFQDSSATEYIFINNLSIIKEIEKLVLLDRLLADKGGQA